MDIDSKAIAYKKFEYLKPELPIVSTTEALLRK
jgi:hypothetical protein